MQLELIGTYYLSGTPGKISFSCSLMMYNIERQWRINPPRVSCIPEGRYELVNRWSPKFNRHVQVMDVPQREMILIHPAHDALHKWKGCIETKSSNITMTR